MRHRFNSTNALALLLLCAPVRAQQAEPASKAVQLESAAAAAEKGADFKDAFDLCVAGVQAADPVEKELESRLRRKVIALHPRLKVKPVLPEEAERRMAYGQAAFKRAEQLEDFTRAAGEFQHAANAAPWWPAAYFNLGLAQEKSGDARAAAKSYSLYLLAAPTAKDAADVRRRMFELEYTEQEQSRKTDEWAGKWMLTDIMRYTQSSDCGSASGSSTGETKGYPLLITILKDAAMTTLHFPSYGVAAELHGKTSPQTLDLSAKAREPVEYPNKVGKRSSITLGAARLILTREGGDYHSKLAFSYELLTSLSRGRHCRQTLMFEYDGPARREGAPK